MALLSCHGGPRPQVTPLAEVRKATFWKPFFASEDWRATPLAARIFNPPPQLLAYVKDLNDAQGIHPPETPNTPADSALRADLTTAIATLPPEVQAKLSPKLIGLFLCHGVGSSGMSESVFDSLGKPSGGIVLFDIDAVNRRANQWCSWRESSPFAQVPSSGLTCTIAKPDQDTRAMTLQLILLHELGHVSAIGSDINPDWDTDIKDLKSLDSFRFAQIDWRLEDGQLHSRWDSLFPLRKDVHYYSPTPSLPFASAAEAYRELGRTDFVSLYAAQTLHEDFAESFMHYVHEVLQGQPFELEQAGTFRYGMDWDSERMLMKRRWFEAWFASP